MNGVDQINGHAQLPKINRTDVVLNNGYIPRTHEKTESAVLGLDLHGLGEEVRIKDLHCFLITFNLDKGLSR